MTIDNDDLLNSIIASLGRIDTISLDELPNIDLYMDQLTSFMNERLKKTARHPDTDKILTKTMINNYSKNDLLPTPEKKKYTKEHLILLIYIYYCKNFLSISDIQTLIEPMRDRFGVSPDELSVSEIYENSFELQKEALQSVMDDIEKKYNRATKTYADADISNEEKKRLQLLSFMTLLLQDVYVKKLIMEKILDNIKDDEEKPAEKQKPSNKDKKKKG